MLCVLNPHDGNNILVIISVDTGLCIYSDSLDIFRQLLQDLVVVVVLAHSSVKAFYLYFMTVRYAFPFFEARNPEIRRCVSV